MGDQIEVAQFCPQCGKEVDSDARFCKYCATNLTQAKESKSESPLISRSAFSPTKEKNEKHERIATNRKKSGVSAWNEYDNKRVLEQGRQGGDNLPREPTFRSQREKADKLAISGVILTLVSAGAVAWGHSYTNNSVNTLKAGFGNLIGQADSTYQIAQFCILFGVIGIIVGIVLFIVGMAQR